MPLDAKEHRCRMIACSMHGLVEAKASQMMAPLYEAVDHLVVLRKTDEKERNDE